VLVAYDVPFRDCEGLSAGGAADTNAYEAWIAGFAAGIGNASALVILEPDALGLIPNNSTLDGVMESCRIAAPGASPSERYAQLNFAVNAIESAAPSARVYLDGTHSAWLSPTEAAYRLHLAGVQNTAGFFLNSSNYQVTSDLVSYGTRVSACLGTAAASGDFRDCDSQYDPSLATTHFVLDTSRNGAGPWSPTASYPDPQTWCNPPRRGVGQRPTFSTGNALADAFVWIKVPGESDGSCNRGVSGSTTDPEWGGITDPAAGVWFPEQALELSQLASPSLMPNVHTL
jgi:endoglucanase